KEVIEIEKKGIKVEVEKAPTIEPSAELLSVFKKNKAFEKAFNALTPGRQRGYLLFFDGAKQSDTKISRIEKYIPRILDGKGINDCTCGLSKRMPNCDGSHKFLKTK
ncbi:MAG: YdeI/OmpD-associated family protein, partial [Chitinophagaceae bacterium]